MESIAGENEKQLLAATVRERLIGKKNSVLYRELLDEKIPTFLFNYLQNTVKKIIHLEEPVQLKHSKRFDYEFGNINQIRASLIQAITEATIFQREELEEIINKTVVLQFDLLVRPNKTLLNIFFKNRPDRIKSEIIQVLEGLEDKRIFIESLLKAIKAFDQYHVSEQDFRRILSNTESQIYEEKFIDAFYSDLKAFCQFLSMIQGYDNQNIKIDFVILLLKERNLEKYVSSFSSADSEKININKIISTLKSSIEAEEQNYEQAAIDEIDKFILRSVSHLKVEGNGYDAEILPPPSEAEKSEADKNFAEQKRKKITKITNAFQDPLERIIVRSKIEEQPDGPLISLKSLIDEKSRQFIIKKIFDNEMSEYAHFISHLDRKSVV